MTPSLFRILLALNEGRLSAPEILRAVATLDPTHRAPSIATFYRKLTRALEAEWLVAVGEVQSESGRPSQVFELTELGRTALRAEATRLQRLASIALTTGGLQGRPLEATDTFDTPEVIVVSRQ